MLTQISKKSLERIMLVTWSRNGLDCPRYEMKGKMKKDVAYCVQQREVSIENVDIEYFCIAWQFLLERKWSGLFHAYYR